MIKNLPYYQLELPEIFETLNTSKEGISDEEVQSRRQVYGQNVLTELHRESMLQKFFKQFKDALIILLIVSTGIAIYLQDYRGATILSIIIIANSIIWYIQEAKAEKIMQSLKKILNPVAKVKRDGKLIEVQAAELVPGDVVFVDEGDSIPADLRIIEEMNLQTNDFSLTGESSPLNKYVHAIKWEADVGQRNNLMYMWTTVATWSGYGVVFATWMNTELGRIATLSHEASPETTPLQRELKNVAQKLTLGTVVLWVVLIAIALLAHFTLHEAFVFAIGIAASMVPQGLPAQVSLSLTLASGRLAKKNALVKQLASVETLGCVNVICTDKTWTLTKNEMTVRNIFLGGKVYEITGSGYDAQGSRSRGEGRENEIFLQSWKHFFLGCFLNAHAKVNPPDAEHFLRYAIGDPTEAALIVLAKKAWYDTEHVSGQYHEIYEFGFDSVRKMMSSIRTVEGETFAYVKWSPIEVLAKCSLYYDGKTIRRMVKRDKDKILETVDGLAEHAMRNLAIAYKPMRTAEVNYTMESVESELVFLWIASIMDPPREEVPAAMVAAYQAHIKVVMITGDSALTAIAIAKKIWLERIQEEPFVVMWDEIRKKSDIQLLDDLGHKRVIFCRASPEDKLRIVSLLKANANIVAVTWDGINDAPALKMANIWVAMWKIWTDVAKEASEIVLLDDSFWTLVNAIREWRIIFQNLKKTILSCITSNGWELFAVLPSLVAKAFWNIPISITVVQILMIDLMAEMTPLTVLALDPASPWLMKEKPRDVKEHVLSKSAIVDLIWAGALMWLIAFTNYILYFVFHRIPYGSIDVSWVGYMTANAVTYTSIVLCQYTNILSRRTFNSDSIFTSYLWSNKKLLLAFLWWFVGMLVIMYVPWIKDFFWFGSMRLVDWLFPIAGAALYLSVREIKKARKRASDKSPEIVGAINADAIKW